MQYQVVLNQVIAFFQRPGKFIGQCSELCGVNHGFYANCNFSKIIRNRIKLLKLRKKKKSLFFFLNGTCFNLTQSFFKKKLCLNLDT